MGRGLTAALLLVALLFGASSELRSEEANDLQGQWQITIPSRPAYNGLALIDAEYVRLGTTATGLSSTAMLPIPIAWKPRFYSPIASAWFTHIA